MVSLGNRELDCAAVMNWAFHGFALQDADQSVRSRAVDLLFTMCDASNAPTIVDELRYHLVEAEYSEAEREELVLKIAILAEKFAPSVQW